MTGFAIMLEDRRQIRFCYYATDAAHTCEAFNASLPFQRRFIHARFSGSEIWTDDAPKLDIIQEAASVMTAVGEVVIGPINAKRTTTAGCMGIYYGEGRGLDACNIFARVVDEDLPLLQALGDSIWKSGAQMLRFDTWPD